MKLLLAFLAALVLLLASCSTSQTYTAEYFDVFDTYTVIVSYGQRVPTEFYAELKHLHKLFDVTREAYDLDDPDVAALIALCDTFKQDSGGTFDHTKGYLYAHYRSLEHDRLPTYQDYDELLKSIIRAERYDFGAVAKGYALDKLYAVALEKGFVGSISIGGSVVFAGRKPDGSDWTLGIEAPDGSGEVSKTVTVAPGTFAATSGTYQRGNHIIDPRTGRPVTRDFSVTILADSGVVADFLSTALFVQDNAALLEQYGAQCVTVR